MRTNLLTTLLPLVIVLCVLLCLQACNENHLAGLDAPDVSANIELPAQLSMAGMDAQSVVDIAPGLRKRSEVKMVPFANGYIYWDGNWADVSNGCNTENPDPNGSILGSLFWVGKMQHLGKVRVDQLLCFNFDPPGIVWTDWTAVAANGDHMTFELTGATAEEPPPGWDHIGHQNITGGTGRFANASGWFDWAWRKECADYSCPEHMLIIRGEISSVGSSK
jgi:hypothetical protein